jgi:signal transduction histidine kinase
MDSWLPPEVLRRLAAVFRDLPDAVRLLADDGSILLCNEASRTLAPDGLGHLCGNQAGDRDSSCPACQLGEVFETGAFRRWHIAVPRPQKTDDYFEVTLCPVADEDGRVEVVLEILRDATATLGLERYLIGMAESQDLEIKKRCEEAGRLSTELGELKRSQTEILYRDRLLALSRMVAGLSHEINTPLGAMLSSADLLQRAVVRLEAAARGIPDESASANLLAKLGTLKSSAEVMVEGSRRIHAVVRTLRLFTRLDEAPRKMVDIHEGLETSLELLQYRIGPRSHVVRDYGELPEILCRPDALNQVFMNLLLNAVQAIEGQGEIRVSTRVEGGEALVEVADDGVGISPEDHANIFELGFTTKGQKGGTGIGLALSLRIIQDHGGSIEVYSRPSRGTKFTLRLPINPSKKEGV